MRKLLILFIFIGGISVSAQTSVRVEDYQETLFNSSETAEDYRNQDYIKDNNYSTERNFKSDLNTKYSGNDFNYTEDTERVETRENQPDTNSNVGGGFTLFGASLPFVILIVLAVIVILAIVQKSDFANFRFKKYKTSDAEILESEEEESIDEGDFERLLKRATNNGNFRLATRYYYLWLLQQLSRKNYIVYHKDKTNTEYQFELKDKDVRSNFSYLSYVYSYIWYGEFPIDQVKFASIEEKYKSFMKQIK